MTRRRPTPSPLPVALAFTCVLGAAISGCTSQGLSRALTPNDKLRDEVSDLKERVIELQKQATVNEVELARLRDRVIDLETELERVRTTSPPGRADITDEAPIEVKRSGHVEEEDLDVPEPAATAPLVEVEEPAPSESASAAVAADVPSTAEGTASGEGDPVSPDAQKVYDQGYTLYHQGQYVEAETVFQRFLQLYGTTELADNALYWIGESRYSRTDYRGALAAFRETVNRYPHGNKVVDALLKSGSTLEKLGDVAGARQSYKEIQRRFPDSAGALVAADRLAKLP